MYECTVIAISADK